jgi:predicted RNase H-like HicB family nuclease
VAEREPELTVDLSHEDPWWVARCLDVELVSQGRSRSEALAMLREALELYFADDDAAASTPLARPRLERLRVRRPG